MKEQIVAKIKFCYPELFEKIQDFLGEHMTQEDIWKANEHIFCFCVANNLRYPELAFVPDFI